MTENTANETVTEITGTEREAAPNHDADASRIASERIVDSAISLGRLWARHGLTLGRLALETSAVSLKTTADLLSAVSEAVAPAKDATPSKG